MKVSTRGRYALRFLLDLAGHQGEGGIPLKVIAERQGISKKYLEQIVTLLAPAGLLRATRGAQGGYSLARDPREVTVADVLRVTEGGIAPIECLEGGQYGCERRETCSTLRMWKGFSDAIESYLSGVTLQDMLEGGSADEYYI